LLTSVPEQQVAGHEVGRRNLLQPAVTDHRRGGSRQPGERRDGILGATFLGEPYGGVQQEDGDDHDGVDRQPLRALREPGDDRDRDGHQQQVDEGVSELVEDLAPPRSRCVPHEDVGTVGGQSVRGLGRGEAQVGIRAEALCNVCGGNRRQVHAHSPR